MSLLISDGGESRNHHVETIEPGPSLDEVEAGRAHQREPKQRHYDKPQVTQGFHFDRWSLVVRQAWLWRVFAPFAEGPWNTGLDLGSLLSGVLRQGLHFAVLLAVGEIHDQPDPQPDDEAGPVDPGQTVHHVA